MLIQRLVEEFLRILEASGRDWHRIAWAIRGLEREIRSAILDGEDSENSELKEYLEERIVFALVLAKDEAIVREEYEWAHEISVRLAELGWKIIEEEEDYVV
jgi:hypothetical protein